MLLVWLAHISPNVRVSTPKLTRWSADARLNCAIQIAAQREFVSFVLHIYVAGGVDELDDSKLSGMIMAKYHSIDDAAQKLGDVSEVRKTFIDFQRHLYLQKTA